MAGNAKVSDPLLVVMLQANSVINFCEVTLGGVANGTRPESVPGTANVAVETVVGFVSGASQA